MKSLFEPAAVDELKTRLERLTPESPRQWGRMNAAQMLAHCSLWMDWASARTTPRRVLLGYVVGRLAKRRMLNLEPMSRNMPTDKGLTVTEQRDFACERERLEESIDRFAAAGPEQYREHSHSFFGPMTPREWAVLGYKHLDHHLRQFGA